MMGIGDLETACIAFGGGESAAARSSPAAEDAHRDTHVPNEEGEQPEPVARPAPIGTLAGQALSGRRERKPI